jgi:hypothetical protein
MHCYNAAMKTDMIVLTIGGFILGMVVAPGFRIPILPFALALIGFGMAALVNFLQRLDDRR